MVALDATPFIEPDSQTGKVVEFRSALNQPNQCGKFIFSQIAYFTVLMNCDDTAASECKTMARDFWQRGFNRWMVSDSVFSISFEKSTDFINRIRLFHQYT